MVRLVAYDSHTGHIRDDSIHDLQTRYLVGIPSVFRRKQIERQSHPVAPYNTIVIIPLILKILFLL